MAPRYAHSIACRLGKFGFLKKNPKKDPMNDKTKLHKKAYYNGDSRNGGGSMREGGGGGGGGGGMRRLL